VNLRSTSAVFASERLQRLDDCLSQAMDMDATARANYLADLQTTDGAFAAELQHLLDALTQSSPLDARPALRLAPEIGLRHRPDDWINQYQLIRLLGIGGMGEVWLARDADAQKPGRPERHVALKLIRSELSAGALSARLQRERDLLARVNHPNIAALLDSGVSPEGEPYLVLEYIAGEPLLIAALQQSLSLKARVEIILAISEAVAAAQAQLIVHRDIKPSNILLTNDAQAKLLDFGIAKALDLSGRGENSTLTRAFGAALTPAYAAPEQLTGAPATTASDVYSIGVVLHELLLGSRPTAALPSKLALQGAIAPGLKLSARQLAQALRGDLDALLTTALTEDPAQRYPNAESLASDLRAYLLGTPLTAQPESFWYRVRKLVQRHRIASACVSVALVMVLLFAGLAWQRSVDARREAAGAHYVQQFIESVMSADLPGEIRDSPLSATELLARGTQAAINDANADPDARLALMLSLARIHRAHRQYSQADELLANAQDLLPQTHASSWQHAALISDRTALAFLLAPTASARAQLEESYQAAIALGASETWRSDALRVLISAAVDHDDGDAARRYADQLIKIPTNDSHAAIGALTQAVVAYSFDQQFRERALVLAQQAQALARQRFGDAHAETAYASMRLGNVLRIKGDIEAAAVELDSAVSIARRAYPAGHLQLARILEELARVRVRQQRLDEGIALWREVLSIRSTHNGADSFAAARSRAFLASALIRRGEIKEGSELALQAHVILKRDLGPYNAQTMDAASYAASALIEQNRTAEAEALLPKLTDAMPEVVDPHSHWRYQELQLLRITTLPLSDRRLPLAKLTAELAANQKAPRDSALLLLQMSSVAINSQLTNEANAALGAAKALIDKDDSTQQSEIYALLKALLDEAPRAQIEAARAVVVKRRGERHFAVRSADFRLQSITH
jgi:eukaryotic-like serine/threonine-protein kinase